jgi:hypothetical protein
MRCRSSFSCRVVCVVTGRPLGYAVALVSLFVFPVLIGLLGAAWSAGRSRLLTEARAEAGRYTSERRTRRNITRAGRRAGPSLQGHNRGRFRCRPSTATRPYA